MITCYGWLFLFALGIVSILAALPWERVEDDDNELGCPECGTEKCCIDDLITIGIVRDIEPEHNYD